MTRAEQIGMVQQFGYTPREAEFMVAVMLHSGYFVSRQYAKGRGKTSHRFIKKVVGKGHALATVYTCNTHVFHIRYKPLYDAIGCIDIRHRRGHESFYIRLKLACLEYALLHKEERFLPTEDEKVEYFHETLGLPQAILPSREYTGKDGTTTRRYFVDKFPIHVGSPASFCYVDDGIGNSMGFSTWLDQYRPLLSELVAPRVVYVAMTPAAFPQAARQFNLKFAKAASLSDDLKAYFELRSLVEQRSGEGCSQADLDRLRRWTRRYSERRFEDQYKAWIGSGEAPAKEAAVTFSTYLLPFKYTFLGSSGARKA